MAKKQVRTRLKQRMAVKAQALEFEAAAKIRDQIQAVEKTLEIAEKMRALGIVPEFSFVVGNPQDPERDVREGIEFIRKIKRINPDAEIILGAVFDDALKGRCRVSVVAAGRRHSADIIELRRRSAAG